MDYYDLNATSYAENTFSHDLGFILDPFAKIIPPGGRILDLGSGSGRDSQAFSQRGFTVWSLDRSRPMLLAHRERGGETLIQADLTWLPFHNGVFDGVWACASLLHVPKARMVFTLSEAHRVLRSEGALFLSLKAGTGEGLDAEGRYWAFYEEDEMADALTIAGFLPLEHSRTADQAGRPVEWINLLATSL